MCVCVDGVGFSPPNRTASSLGSQQQPRTHHHPHPPPHLPHHILQAEEGPHRRNKGELEYNVNNSELLAADGVLWRWIFSLFLRIKTS